MLCDLAVRKLSPGTSSGSSNCKQQSPGASCNSPRRLRRTTRTPTAETDQGKELTVCTGRVIGQMTNKAKRIGYLN